MAFTVPNFNLLCSIYTAADITLPARLSAVQCNLAWSRRVSLPAIETDVPVGSSTFAGTMTLLLPVGTDIRDGLNSTGADAVQVPAGSGRFYRVVIVDDIGKGFANEHRAAQLVKVGGLLGVWPTPIP